MDTIRMMVIVTLVMEITRKLPEDPKAKLRALCDKILAKRSERGEIDAARRDRLDKVDGLRIINVTNVKLADVEHRDELLRWFSMERDVRDQDGEVIEDKVEGAFHASYKEALQDIASPHGSAAAKSKHQYQTLTRDRLEREGDLFSPPYEDLFWTLIRIFEHVNFFNLLAPAAAQQFSGENLWLYRHIQKQKGIDDDNPRHDYAY